MCVYIYSIYRSLPRVTEKFCRRSLASPPLLTVLSLSRASILIESRGTDALLRRSARHRHTQPRVPENDAMERTTAVESVVAQRERVWERERESWVGEQEGRRWEWEGGCERGRKVGSGGRVRDSGRANVLSETRDPERESVYRAFREHERRSEERGGGDGLSLIVPTAAHEPLKVPYKYGPVNVRRPPLLSLSLSLSLFRPRVGVYVRDDRARRTHIGWLWQARTYARVRACFTDDDEDDTRPRRAERSGAPSKRHARLYGGTIAAEKNATTGGPKLRRRTRARSPACLPACLASTWPFFHWKLPEWLAARRVERATVVAKETRSRRAVCGFFGARFSFFFGAFSLFYFFPFSNSPFFPVVAFEGYR